MNKQQLIISLFAASFSTFLSAQQSNLSLAGAWDFKVDPQDRGMVERWFTGHLDDKVTLPGSMTTNGKGDAVTVGTPWTGSMWNRAWYESPDYARYRDPKDTKVVFWLQPDTYYTGAAWYQKRVTIPKDWKDKEVFLSLERCHWETTLWVDGQPVGMNNSLSVPHRYTLSSLTPGEHTLTLRVDNRVKEIEPGPDAHSISDNTQSNWNGLVGELVLEARPKTFLFSIRIVPSVKEKQIVVEVKIENRGTKALKASIGLQAKPTQEGASSLPLSKQDCQLEKGVNSIRLTYPMGENPALWDEFHPNLYTLQVQLDSKAGQDVVTEPFGMREIVAQGSQIFLNGRPLFFRGTLECAIFPETGYPPTDEAEWERIMTVCRDHGLNHIRFHSWCPPKAAFSVADRLGFYLYVECASWAHDIGSGKPIDQFVMDEGERIVREYANHPSFCLFSYGNEPGGAGHVKYLTDFVNHWKSKDRRFLTTTASGWPAADASDFHCLPAPRVQGWGEGIKSIINSQKPGSGYDWQDRISKTQPTISHEIGQWCVYPDLKERSQYTGVLKAKNFDIFEDRLRDNGLIHLADSFLLASGKLQTLCYKADIEAALRTRGFAGFQLLDLHDFPGQGTALVGVLNPFWRSKGYVTAEEYKRFCSPLVPLARMNRFVLNSGETLEADIEVAQYLSANLTNARTDWKLISPDGSTHASGFFTSSSLPTGMLTKVGTLRHKVEVSKATCFQLELAINGSKNSWNVWVYPTQEEATADVKVVSRLDKEAISLLDKGGKVLLSPSFGTMHNADSVVVGFSTIFWNTLWTRMQPPHTLGILCDPQHPALAHFPTNYHSDYQWQDAMSHCQAIPLKQLGRDIRPIVRIIDDWFTARPFGLIVELKVGNGKLILCAADLLTDTDSRPEARQLKNSLLRYMKSTDFQPMQSATLQSIQQLLKD